MNTEWFFWAAVDTALLAVGFVERIAHVLLLIDIRA
jgi:hypothetical protein